MINKEHVVLFGEIPNVIPKADLAKSSFLKMNHTVFAGSKMIKYGCHEDTYMGFPSMRNSEVDPGAVHTKQEITTEGVLTKEVKIYVNKNCVRFRTSKIHGNRKLDKYYPLIYKNGSTEQERARRARAEYVRRRLTNIYDYYKCHDLKSE